LTRRAVPGNSQRLTKADITNGVERDVKVYKPDRIKTQFLIEDPVEE